MDDYQFWALVIMLAGGFGWIITWLRSIDQRLNGLENRVATVETRIAILETRMGFIERLIEMTGFRLKIPKESIDIK